MNGSSGPGFTSMRRAIEEKRRARYAARPSGAARSCLDAQAGVVCRQGSLGHSALVTPWLSLRDNSQVTSAPVAPRVGLREIITSGLVGRRDS